MDTVRREVYRRADIRNVLRSVVATNSSLLSLIVGDEKLVYEAGFVAAIRATAIAFELEGDLGTIRPSAPLPNHLLVDLQSGVPSRSSSAAVPEEPGSW